MFKSDGNVIHFSAPKGESDHVGQLECREGYRLTKT